MKKELSQELRNLKGLIAELVRVPAVHGHEEAMMEFCRDRFAATADKVEVDVRGNVYATFEADGDDRTFMLAAHMDGIGLVVRHIEEKGFLRFDGNVMGLAMCSRRVWVHGSGEPVLGTTSVKLGYGITPPEERAKVPSIKDMHIDIGCQSRDEVEKLGIGVGDPITYHGETENLGNPHRVVSPILDDRAGVAVLLTLAQAIRQIRPRSRVVLTGTVEEEVGTRGAATAAFSVAPDAAISVDTQPAGGTPDVPEHLLPFDIGRGPIVKVHEGYFTRTTHPRVRQLLLDAAKEAGVQVQVGGSTPGGSDMGAMQQAGAGIPAAAIAIPRRYAHSPNEVIDIRDPLGAIKVLREAIRLFGNGYSLMRI